MSYSVDGVTFTHSETKTDHQRRQYQVGTVLELIHERGNPGNAIDVRRKRWDDVIGPLVFGLLLLAFMTWLLLFISGMT